MSSTGDKTQNVVEKTKDIMNVRSGHLARLTHLLRQIEHAMAENANGNLVLELQGKVGAALVRFRESSAQYVKSLTDPADIQQEIDVVKKHDEGKRVLDSHIDSYLQELQQDPRPSSRADSRHSTASQEAERNRKLLELQLSQLIRRQDSSRKDEEAERVERQKELDRQERHRKRKEEKSREAELLDVQDQLERAQLEEQLLVSDGDDSLLNDSSRFAVTSAQNTNPSVVLRQFAQSDTPRPNNLPAEVTEDPATRHTNDKQASATSCLTSNTSLLHPSTNYPAHTPANDHREAHANTQALPNLPRNALGPEIPYQPSLHFNPSRPMPIYSVSGGLQSAQHHYQPSSSQNYFGPMPAMPPYGPNYMSGNMMAMPHPYCAPGVNYYHPHRLERIVNSLDNMTSAFYSTPNLPKPELKIFSGDPRDFSNFKNAYVMMVESKTQDNRTRLHYLIQYCSGAARNAIEHCAMFPDPAQGLSEAKAILSETFGQPYEIVQAYKSPILKWAYIKAHDYRSLGNLATEMRKCQIALSQLGFFSDINNSETLLRIVWKLPFHLQNKWVAKANEIQQYYYRDPNFADLTEFIRSSARMANTFYGRNIRRSEANQQSRSVAPNYRQPPLRTTLASIAVSSSNLPTHPNCLFCKQHNHSLGDCAKFHELETKERYSFAFKEKICHNCLLVGHLALGCLQRGMCLQEGCRKKHHNLFHPVRTGGVNVTTAYAAEEGDNSEEAETNDINEEVELPELMEDQEIEEEPEFTVNCSTIQSKTCLHVVPVIVNANGKEFHTHALLDTGSDVTLCTKRLISSLGVRGKPTVYNINTINKAGRIENGVELSLVVSSLDKQEHIDLPKVWSVCSIPISNRSMPTIDELQRWPHLKGIEFPRMENITVDLLIGGDTPEAFWVLDQRLGGRKEPYAIKTLLGWSLMGPLKQQSLNTGTVNKISRDQVLSEQVESFWKTEFNDIQVLGKREMSKNDIAAVKAVEMSLSKASSGYRVGLPWRVSREELHGNISMAQCRLRSLKRRLLKDAEMLTKYTNTVESYINSGYARVVPEEEVNTASHSYWYLPHHPVLHQDKPGKVRVVFDCAATFNGTSLNKSLHSGPDVTSSLLGVLLRFRKERYALVGDIESMFHQIKMAKDDWEKLCFLWWKNGDLNSTPITCQMTVHLFGATSSPFCANYCLKRTAADNRSSFGRTTINAVHRSFYVDDCLVSVSSIPAAKEMHNQLTKLLKMGGFHITKWMSNSREVIKSIDPQELAPSMSELDLELSDLPLERALGILWDTSTDRVGFKCSLKNKPLTKRGVLSTISSIYDPMGMVAPFILKGKYILQELTRLKCGWDESLPHHCLEAWNRWLKEVPKLSSIRIPRCLKHRHNQKIRNTQLHHFCDASSQGYGAVSYIRYEDIDGRTSVSFLLGKSRLAPIKPVTIPRLELSAATLAVKLNGMLQRELDMNIDSTTYWSDSEAVLKYINNNTRRFQTFVANRLSLIDSGSSSEQWRFIKSDKNPADEASRGMSSSEFSENCRWFCGPQFLANPPSSWPSAKVETAISLDDPELRREAHICNVSTPADVIFKLFARYSNWHRLLRAVSWIRRFVFYLASKRNCQRHHSSCGITAEELDRSEHSVISYLQRNEFTSLFSTTSTDNLKKIPRTLRQLHPIKVDGILRVGGRLKHAPIDYNSKHPIIVPRGHVARLIVRSFHQKNGHVGCSHTWTLIRQRFWIICGGAEVRKVIGKCMQCMKRNAKPANQIMSDLPLPRVTPDQPPFNSTGVDFFGPFMVKQGRSIVKRYGCLFTCLASRAVHLEVSIDLSTSSFINAIRRFINRRGCPVEMYSDNGTNFVGAEKEFRKAHVESFMSERRIKWTFITPRSPHMGGVWERLVRSVKTILKSILQDQMVNDESLHTLLIEVEHIVNSRPLIPVTLDPTGEEPLTPNHLLLLRSETQPMREFDKGDNYATRRWRQVQYLAQQFWRRWKTEYLPVLQRRSKWTTSKTNLKPGDLVLMAEDNVPRGRWPIARIVECFPGKDDKVRQVKVKTRGCTYVRPIVKLYVLKMD